MDLALLLLASIGATLIVVRGRIFAPVRRLWPALFECAQCAGMWVGVAAGAWLAPMGRGHALDGIVLGTATSFAALLADAVLLNLLGDPSDGESKEP